MTYFIFQTFLLLAAAYLLGAIIGYILRSLFAGGNKKSVETAAVAVGAVAATAAASQLAVADEGKNEKDSGEQPVDQSINEPEVLDVAEGVKETTDHPQATSDVVEASEDVVQEDHVPEAQNDVQVTTQAPESQDLAETIENTSDVSDEVQSEVVQDAQPQDYVEQVSAVTETPVVNDVIDVVETQELETLVPEQVETQVPEQEVSAVTEAPIVNEVIETVQEDVVESFAPEQVISDDIQDVSGEAVNEAPITDALQEAPQEFVAPEVVPQEITEAHIETPSPDLSGGIDPVVSAGAVVAEASENSAELISVANKGRLIDKQREEVSDVAHLSESEFAKLSKDRPVQKPHVVPDRSALKEDLKQIKGIGVVLESQLHGLGVKSYQQIASWSPSDVAEIDKKLNAEGRISTEKWVEQAQALTGDSSKTSE